MHLISLPRLRMKELQTLAENSIKICQPIEEVKPALQQVESALAAFIQGMLKDKSTGVSKKTLDKRRDYAISGFFNVIKAEKYFPHEDENVVEAIIKLSAIINRFGLDIIRLPYDEETSAVDNMIAEIKEFESYDLLDVSVTRWIPVIEKLNEEFKTASKEFITAKTVLNNRDSATTLAPYLTEALEGLYTMMFAYLKIGNNEAINKAYNEVNTLVDGLK